MAIQGLGVKTKVYTNVIPFPATKITAQATYQSAVYNPFEDGAYGPCKIFLHADSRASIGKSPGAGDTIDVNVYVSFSHGDSWMKVLTLKDLRYNTLPSTSLGSKIDTMYIIPLAPRVKVEAVLAASDSLCFGHGCRVDLEFDELYPGVKRYSYIEDVKTRTYGFIGDTHAASMVIGTPGFADSAPRVSAAINCGFVPSRIFVWAIADDITKVLGKQGLGFSHLSYQLQTSSDGTNWVFGDSLKKARPGRSDSPRCLFVDGSATTGIIFNGWEEIVPTTNTYTASYSSTTGFPGRLGQFLRLSAVSDSLTAGSMLTRGHGIRYHLIAFE